MNAKTGVSGYDQNIYGRADEKGEFLDYIPDEAAGDKAPDVFGARKNQRLAGITGQKDLIEEMKLSGPQEDPMKDFGHKKIVEREDKYHQRRLNRGALSPDRVDPFAKPTGLPAKAPIGPANTTTGLGVKRTYYDIMTEQSLENERADIYRKIEKQEEEKKRNIN